MIEKNIRKNQYKRYRIQFEGRLCTVEHKSKRHPGRNELKKQTASEIKKHLS